MNIAKQNMINCQLINRGVTNPEIINAFLSIAKEEFVPKIYAKQAYIDFEIPSFENNKSIIRPYVIAKIAELALEAQPKTILIIGDVLGYTAEIFSKFCDKCFIGAISKQDKFSLNNLPSKNIECVCLEDLLATYSQFDFIFCDSGFYKSSTIKHITKTKLSNQGALVCFNRTLTTTIQIKQFHFSHATISKINKTQSTDMFNFHLFLSNSNLA